MTPIHKSKKHENARLKYTDYSTIVLKLEFSMPCLGGFPSDQAPYWSGQKSALSRYFDQVLHRDAEGNPIISRGQFRGLIREAARFMGLSPVLKDYVFAEDSIITINKRKTSIPFETRQVCIPVNAGSVGRGLIRHEAAPIGSAVIAQFRIPTSVLSVEGFIKGINMAGRTIGLGAGRKLGFGSFTVSSVKDCQDSLQGLT